LLQSYGDYWAAMLKQHASSTVTYTRGAHSVDIAATVGGPQQQQPNVLESLTLDVQTRTFTFEAADLILNGVTVKPERGDRITLAVGTQTFTFDLLPTDDKRWWRESDSYGKRLRVVAQLAARA
jgi:hypothetical protein